MKSGFQRHEMQTEVCWPIETYHQHYFKKVSAFRYILQKIIYVHFGCPIFHMADVG